MKINRDLLPDENFTELDLAQLIRKRILGENLTVQELSILDSCEFKIENVGTSTLSVGS